MNLEKLLKQLAQGALRNVSFRDMVNLVEKFGFRLIRVNGSHHIYSHPWRSWSIFKRLPERLSPIRFASSCG
jgi:hypothetical protein